MIKNTTKRLVIAGIMLVLGILLPFVTSHGFGLPTGSIFLPMHLPVFLCAFFSGPFFGGLCGFILPYLNSILTGMPAMLPNAVVMSFELLAYAVVSGSVHRFTGYSIKLRYIYISLISAMISGRVVYAAVAYLMFRSFPGIKYLSVITAAAKGFPGIILQLISLPAIIKALSKNIAPAKNAVQNAVAMITNKQATCVVVKNNKLIASGTVKGISYILELYDNGILKDAFVADTVVGKAAAIIFSCAGVKKCYAETISKPAMEWLDKNHIPYTYSKSADVIINRKGDDMCPMEKTVLDITNPEEAIVLLKQKVAMLRAAK